MSISFKSLRYKGDLNQEVLLEVETPTRHLGFYVSLYLLSSVYFFEMFLEINGMRRPSSHLWEVSWFICSSQDGVVKIGRDEEEGVSRS